MSQFENTYRRNYRNMPSGPTARRTEGCQLALAKSNEDATSMTRVRNEADLMRKRWGAERGEFAIGQNRERISPSVNS
jgi:hypothetical protein